MFDEKYFEDIDSEIKGYVLGLILYNIKSHDIVKKTFVVEVSFEEDTYFSKSFIDKNREIIQEEFNKIGECHFNKNNNTLGLKINSPYVIQTIKDLLNVNKFLSVCDLDLTILFEKIKNIKIQTAFIKAYVEKYGDIQYDDNGDVKLHITFYLEDNIKHINKLNIPFEKIQLFNLSILSISDVNFIDFMGIIYKNNDIPIINYKQYKVFKKTLINNDNIIPDIKIYKTDTNAIIPFKNRESDAGYDITIIKKTKVLNNKTTLYDTGIKMKIPNGYYVEIVPRSSLSKSGYMLANSVGIIDQSYRGNIFVALTKIVEESPDLEMPFKCCQMIIRKQIYGTITEKFSEFEKTDRGNGGFGSTN